MANWQSIAANRDLSPRELYDVKVGLFRSAAIQMVAPAALGTLFGAALRLTNPGIPDDGYFGFAIRPLLSSTTPLNGVVLGFLFLGFIGIAISSAGSYLLAAMQTLAIDIFKRKSISALYNRDTPSEARKDIEQSVLDWVKRMMIPVVVGMTVIFALLYYGLSSINRQGLAFQFQFVMYGAAVTLVPSVLFALFRPTDKLSPKAGLWSICVGLICVIVPFGLAETIWSHLGRVPQVLSADDIVNLTPLLGLASSVSVYAVVRRMEMRDV